MANNLYDLNNRYQMIDYIDRFNVPTSAEETERMKQMAAEMQRHVESEIYKKLAMPSNLYGISSDSNIVSESNFEYDRLRKRKYELNNFINENQLYFQKTKIPKFVGGPKDGEPVGDRLTNSLYDDILIRVAHPLPNAARWQDTVDSMAPLTFDEYKYRLGADGDYYLDECQVYFTPEDEQLIIDTHSDRITFAERKIIAYISKRPEWQDVRKLLLGKWKRKPELCCKRLREFLGSIKLANNDHLRLILNYLTSTGFSSGSITHQSITILRKQISLEIAHRKFNGTWERRGYSPDYRYVSEAMSS